MTVDTEEEWTWGAGWPTSHLSVQNIQRLPKFQALCSRHGVRATYFVNHAVMNHPVAAEQILSLGRSPDVELGMHIHPWNTPPLEQGKPVGSRDTYLHNYPQEIIAAKLGMVYQAFEAHGLAPRTFRGGRYSCGEQVRNVLRDLGFIADASVVPFTFWHEDGAPDYRNRGLLPERLSPRFEGDLPFWEIPLTLAYSRGPFRLWSKFYETVETTWLRYLKLIGIVEALGLSRKIWLNFEDPLGRDMETLLSLLRDLELPSICFTLHSSSLVAGMNSYTPNQEAEDRLYAHMDRVFSLLRGWPEFQSATVSEVALSLERDHHARARN